MLLTITFVTPFGFVSWTIPYPLAGFCRLVSTPSFAVWRKLGSGLPCAACATLKASPNLTDKHLQIAPQIALCTDPYLKFRLRFRDFKPTALTAELRALIFNDRGTIT